MSDDQQLHFPVADYPNTLYLQQHNNDMSCCFATGSDQVTNVNSNVKRVEKRKRGSKKKKVDVEVPSGCVHVRARRGEATDSHSLAERVRRQKISMRMKLLQSLVPGCDQLTGKTLILDEIIKYVKTLQSQVQFLLAKVATLDHMNEFHTDFSTNSSLLHQKTGIIEFDEQPSILDPILHQTSDVSFTENFNLQSDGNEEDTKEVIDEYGFLHDLYYSF